MPSTPQPKVKPNIYAKIDSNKSKFIKSIIKE